MSLKVKQDQIVLFIWAIIVACKVLSDTVFDFFISLTFVYYLGSVALILFLVNRLLTTDKKASSKYYIWMILFLFYVFIFGVVFANKNYIESINNNVRMMLTFYLVAFLMGAYIEKRSILADVIRVSFVTLSIIIVTLFVLNIDTLHNPVDLLRNFFAGYERTRNAIGFMHPNFAGNTALAAIMISAFYNRKNTKMKTRVLVYLADVIFMYVILESASRTSFIAVVLFVLIRAYIIVLKRIKGTFSRIMLTIILVLICLLLLDFSMDISLMDIFLLTNRAGNFFYNIPILESNNALWTGLAYIGSGDFISTSYGTFYVDNYLLYTLMSTGIIGLIFNIIFMISLSIKVFKIANKSSSMYKNIELILIVNIIMSMTETCFMYPSFSSSYIFTVLYLSVFAKKITKQRNDVNYCE